MNDSSRTTALTITLCVLAAFCDGFDLQVAGVAAAGIRPEFHPSQPVLGSFFSASTLGFLIGAVSGGWLGDRIGRRRVVVPAIALFGLCSLLTTLPGTMVGLYWARLATGVGLGLAVPVLVTLASESSRADRRTANVTLVYAGMPIGGAAVSAMATAIAPVHWRWLFIAGGVVPLLVTPAMALLLRESPAFQSERDASAGSGRPRAGTLASVLAEGRAVPTLLLWVTYFLELLLLYLLLNWLPTLLTGKGFSGAQATGAQVGFNVGGAISVLIIGQYLESKHRGAILLAIFIALPLLITALARSGQEFGMVALLVCLLGIAVLAAQAFLISTAPALYPTLIRGAGAGIAIAIGRAGSWFGPLLAGWLRGLGHGTAQLLIDILPLAIIGSITGLILARYRSRVPR